MHLDLKSEVYIQYGDPIYPSQKYKDKVHTDFKNSVSDVTQKIEESLLNLTTNLTFIDLEDTISYLEIIYKNELFLKKLIRREREA